MAWFIDGTTGSSSMTKSDTLLSRPLEGSTRTEVRFWRNSSSDEVGNQYENLSGDFVHPLGQGRNYSRQYFHIYRHRLEALRQRVVESAHAVLGKDVVIKNLCDLDKDEDAGETDKQDDVLVVGTLFKHQPLKPNILQELSEDNGIQAQPILTRKSKFISGEDEIILEDELQRIKLLPSPAGSKFSVAALSTGIVCGVYGSLGLKSQGDGGKFFVKDCVFPLTPNPPKLPKIDTDRYIAILSGLNLNGSDASSLGPLDLAISWLTGEAGDMADQEKMSRVCRVIVAGNCLAQETRDNDDRQAKYLTKNKEATSIDAINALDDILAQLADTVEVDLMPGANDPANQSLPQQPLHKCLFPKSGVYPTFQSVPNPYSCTVSTNGVEVVGTSGQNLLDLMSNTDIEDPLDALECLLKYGHLVPTSPDTLGCYPYHDRDPFVMARKPSIFFAANQKEFGQRSVEHQDGSKTICIAVPEFSTTGLICLVNIHSLECEQIGFEFELQ